MSRRIDVEVDSHGHITVEFSGFQGETCFDEADALQRALREMGLWAIPVSVSRKSATQIEEETAAHSETKKRVPLS